MVSAGDEKLKDVRQQKYYFFHRVLKLYIFLKRNQLI